MNDRQRNRIRRLVAQDLTIPEIAHKMGIAQDTIYRFCQREGIKINRMRNRLPGTLAEIHKWLKRLGNVDKVATHFGVTRQAVYYRLAQED